MAAAKIASEIALKRKFAPTVNAVQCKLTRRDREMGLADAGWSEENHVLGAFDESEARQFHDLLARCAVVRLESYLGAFLI